MKASGALKVLADGLFRGLIRLAKSGGSRILRSYMVSQYARYNVCNHTL